MARSVLLTVAKTYLSPVQTMSAKQEAKAPEVAAEAVVAPTGLKAKLPLIAMIAVGLAVGGGTGAAVIGPMVAKKMGKAVQPAAHADSASAEGEGAGKAGKEGEKGKEGSAAAAMHVLENLVLNPAGSGGSRFLLLSVAIEAGSSKANDDFTARDAELRDIILTSLGGKTVDELVDMTARERIKVEVQGAVNARFGKNAVKRLYFPQFVVQ